MPSKSCHNCNVESDRAVRARGRALPARARALHRAGGGAGEDRRRVRGLWRRRANGPASSPCALEARSAPRPRAVNLRPGSARPGWGEVLRFSFTGQIEQRSCYLRCFFRRRFIRESPSDCREPVATGSLVRSTQPVDIFAFALEMLAKFLLTKAARRERALGLSLTLRQPQRNSALKQSVLEPRTAVSFQRAGWFTFPILFCNSVTPSFK